ncbi:MAG: T9SS type A sorting domain-containing protein [Candidatus Eisenbacteria bacterium]|nr:T9SS type A sorting domain-containing protein [Candidatus Eisenbacteria bacterium]
MTRARFVSVFLVAAMCLAALAGVSRADRWASSKHNAPPSRSFASMVVDSVSGSVFLFGGFRSQTDPTGLNDLWMYDPLKREWSQPAVSGAVPPPTWLHQAVYDGARRRMVVFGGTTSAVRALDLATLEWSTIVTHGDVPPPTTGHGMMFDRDLDRLVVFGGNYLQRLYYLDFATLDWTRVPEDSTFPAARSFHSFLREHIVQSRAALYGGFDGVSTYFNDLWQLDLATMTWSRITSSGAPAEGRAGHIAAVRPSDERMFVTGGHGLRSAWKDTYSYNFMSAQWESLGTLGEPPWADEGACGTMLKNLLVEFGGRSRFAPGESNDFHRLNLFTFDWSQVDTVPSERYDHVAFRDPVGELFHVFGGVHAGSPAGDLWRLNGATDSWLRIDTPTAPSARSGSCVSVDSIGRHAYLFGGDAGTSLRRDTWSYSFDSLTWNPVNVNRFPPRRKFAAMVADFEDRKMWMFGGYGTAGPLGDLWCFSPDSAKWDSIPAPEGPGARYLTSLTYDPIRRELLVFGGSNDTTALGDLWAFSVDSLTWRRQLQVGTWWPASREGHSAVMDLENQMVVHGGAPSPSAAPIQDTWMYDPHWRVWNPVPLTSPPAPARWRHAATWNPVNRRMRVFGGLVPSGPLNDLWLLELLAGAVDAPAPQPATILRLRPPLPNPSRGDVRVDFALTAGAADADVAVFDAAGRRVARLWRGPSDGAAHSVTWNGRGDSGGACAAGVYFVRVRAGSGAGTVSRKLVRL